MPTTKVFEDLFVMDQKSRAEQRVTERTCGSVDNGEVEWL